MNNWHNLLLKSYKGSCFWHPFTSRLTIHNLDELLSWFWTSPLFQSGSNCCFLTCIQVFFCRQKRWSGIPISLRISQFVKTVTVIILFGDRYLLFLPWSSFCNIFDRSLCYTLEANITLYTNYTSIKKNSTITQPFSINVSHPKHGKN